MSLTDRQIWLVKYKDGSFVRQLVENIFWTTGVDYVGGDSIISTKKRDIELNLYN